MTTRSRLVQRLSAVLQDHPRTREAGIDVVDENGIITLKGTVASDNARQAAKEITRQQEGVIQVINELKVETGDQEGEIPLAATPVHDVRKALPGSLSES